MGLNQPRARAVIISRCVHVNGGGCQGRVDLRGGERWHRLLQQGGHAGHVGGCRRGTVEVGQAVAIGITAEEGGINSIHAGEPGLWPQVGGGQPVAGRVKQDGGAPQRRVAIGRRWTVAVGGGAVIGRGRHPRAAGRLVMAKRCPRVIGHGAAANIDVLERGGCIPGRQSNHHVRLGPEVGLENLGGIRANRVIGDGSKQGCLVGPVKIEVKLVTGAWAAVAGRGVGRIPLEGGGQVPADRQENAGGATKILDHAVGGHAGRAGRGAIPGRLESMVGLVAGR